MYQGLPELRKWRICVYVRKCNVDAINDELEMNLGGQRRVRCAIHEQFLVKQPTTCTLQCCIRLCTRSCRWICQARRLQCLIGLWYCHGKDLVNKSCVSDVNLDMTGRLLRNKQPRAATVALATSDSESDCDVDERILAPLRIDDFSSADDWLPLHSRKDSIPVYDVNRRVPGHYLWNDAYSVMHRTDRYSRVRSNAILHHIVAAGKCASVSLLYPEAQLFPRIF